MCPRVRRPACEGGRPTMGGSEAVKSRRFLSGVGTRKPHSRGEVNCIVSHEPTLSPSKSCLIYKYHFLLN